MAAATALSAAPRPLVTQKAHWTDRVAHAALALVALALVAFLAFPLLAILQQALEGKEGLQRQGCCGRSSRQT